MSGWYLPNVRATKLSVIICLILSCTKQNDNPPRLPHRRCSRPSSPPPPHGRGSAMGDSGGDSEIKQFRTLISETHTGPQEFQSFNFKAFRNNVALQEFQRVSKASKGFKESQGFERVSKDFKRFQRVSRVSRPSSFKGFKGFQRF